MQWARASADHDRAEEATVVPSRGMPAADGATLVLALCLTVGPFLWELFRGNVLRRLFSIAAADTFYYLTVARNIATVGRASFDGEKVTNGFHPLWQGLTAAGALVVRIFRLDDVWSLAWALGTGLGLAALCVYLLGVGWRNAEGRIPALFVLVPLGGATFVHVPAMLHFWSAVGRPSTTIWGAVNGMETAAVVAAYGASFWAYTLKPGRRTPYLVAVALLSLALARLDHAVVAVSLAVTFLVTDRDRVRSHALVLGVFFLGLLVYVAQNKLFFGSALPTSGTLKSTFPAFAGANQRLLEKLFAKPSGIRPTDGHRYLQMLIPPAFASVACLVIAARVSLSRTFRVLTVIDRLVLGTAIGVIGLTAYNFLFVPSINQGHWYYPVPNLFVTLALLWGARVVPAVGGRGARAAAAVALTAAVLYGYVSYVSPGEGVSRNARFYFDEAPAIRAFYQGKPVKLVEYDDGVVAFSTGFPAFSGTGLVIDQEALPAARKNRLLDVALRRGFDRLTTLNYVHRRVGRSASAAAIRDAYRLGNQAPRCKFEVEYLSSDGHFSIIRTTCGG